MEWDWMGVDINQIFIFTHTPVPSHWNAFVEFPRIRFFSKQINQTTRATTTKLKASRRLEE